jgi:hypothetical protein
MQVILLISSVAFVSLFNGDDYLWIISWGICLLVFFIVAILRLTRWRLCGGRMKVTESDLVKKSLSWQFDDTVQLLSKNKTIGKHPSDTV